MLQQVIPDQSMEMFNLTPNFLFFSSFIFLLIIKLVYSISTKTPPNSKTLPPSPPKLPIIGHLHLLLGEVPHRALRRVSRKYGPVLHLQIGQLFLVLVSARRATKELLKDQDSACAGRPESIGAELMWYNYTDIVFSPYNDYWRQMRMICVKELLSMKNVRSFGSIRQDEVSRLVKSIRSSIGIPVSVTEKFSSFTTSFIWRTAFGGVGMDRERLLNLYKKGSTLGAGFLLADIFPSVKLLRVLSWNRYKLLGMRREVDVILNGIIEEHKAKRSGEFGGEDIVDVLLRLQRDDALVIPITNDNIKAILADVFSGGSETSSTLLDWAMAELMRNPRVMEKAQSEIRDTFKGKKTIEESDVRSLKYLKLVIKETLRFHPPAPMLLRKSRDECKVDGYTVPVNTKILVNIWSLGRDPEYWTEPEIFQPERFDNSSVDFLGNNFEFLPFGLGKRMCPGMDFGLANVEIPLAHLLYHFDWKMPQGVDPDDIDMNEAEGLTAPRKTQLILVPTFYEPSTVKQRTT